MNCDHEDMTKEICADQPGCMLATSADMWPEGKFEFLCAEGDCWIDNSNDDDGILSFVLNPTFESEEPWPVGEESVSATITVEEDGSYKFTINLEEGQYFAPAQSKGNAFERCLNYLKNMF